MFSIFPELNEENSQIFTEMIFIVDRSGSMSGARINSGRGNFFSFVFEFSLKFSQ
jgi:hypothetical protein